MEVNSWSLRLNGGEMIRCTNRLALRRLAGDGAPF